MMIGKPPHLPIGHSRVQQKALGMCSVKPFELKNRDKIYLEAPSPNLKKLVIEIFERQPNH